LVEDILLDSHLLKGFQHPHITTTNTTNTTMAEINGVTTMERFRADVIVLHAPTGELRRYREDFDTLEAAISRPFWFLRELHDDQNVQLECDSWTNLNAQPRDDGVEEVFGCYFRAGGRDEVHGMVLVTVLPQSNGTEPGV
jgi:hypothetical protein